MQLSRHNTEGLIHICILVTRRDVPKMTYTWMKFFQSVDLSNYLASRIQYFHIDNVFYNTIMTLIYKYGATMDITHKQIKRYQQVIFHDVNLHYIPTISQI